MDECEILGVGGDSCFSHLSPPKAIVVEDQALNAKVFRDD